MFKNLVNHVHNMHKNLHKDKKLNYYNLALIYQKDKLWSLGRDLLFNCIIHLVGSNFQKSSVVALAKSCNLGD